MNDYTCEFCQSPFRSADAYISHKNGCPENPRALRERIDRLSFELRASRNALLLMGEAIASYRIYTWFVPCPFCGPGTPNTATDCEGCDGHGRAPHERMKDDPQAVYDEIIDREALVDANPICAGVIAAAEKKQVRA